MINERFLRNTHIYIYIVQICRFHIEYKTLEFPKEIIIEKYILLYNLSKSYFVNQICLISKHFNFVNNNEYKFSIASILNINYLYIVNYLYVIQFLVITSEL